MKKILLCATIVGTLMLGTVAASAEPVINQKDTNTIAYSLQTSNPPKDDVIIPQAIEDPAGW